jgi:hypothetical protein
MLLMCLEFHNIQVWINITFLFYSGTTSLGLNVYHVHLFVLREIRREAVTPVKCKTMKENNVLVHIFSYAMH